MEVPDMKTGILAAIRQKKAVSHRRRMRPAAIAVIAAMLALFGITVGAGTSGMLNLQNGSKYSFMDADGKIVKPTGFHLEEDVDVSLSEKAMDNITPYILPLTAEEERFFETVSLEEMEDHTLPDGTPVTIAAAKYQEGGLVAHALYRKDEAVYHVRVFENSKHELMENVKEVLDTVE